MAQGQYGSYSYESQESRALATITSDSYDKDQAKNLIKLNNDVGYMAAYMRKMQKGIDEASQNFIQQIQAFIADIIVLLGGGDSKGFDFGDLRYVLQMIGALLGFNTEGGIAGLLPLNAFSAVWHMLSTYIFPTAQFGDVINALIDNFVGFLLDQLGELPIVGEGFVQFAVWLTQLRDFINGLGDALGGFFNIFGGDWASLDFGIFEDIWNTLTALFETITEPIATALSPVLATISSWSQSLLDGLSHVVTAVTNFVSGLTGGSTNFANLWNNFNPLTFIANAISQLISKGIHAILPGANLTGSVSASLLTGFIDVVNRISSIPASLLTGFISTLRFNDLPANLLTGTIDVINRITSIPSNLLTGFIDILRIPDFSANKITSGILDVIRIPELALTKITGLVGELGARISKTFFNLFNANKTVNLASDPQTKQPTLWAGDGLTNIVGDFLEIQKPAGTYRRVHWLRNADGGNSAQYIPVTPERSFEMSVDAKIITGGGSFTLLPRGQNAAGSLASIASATFTATTTLATFTHRFKVPTNASNQPIEFMPILEFRDSNPEGSVLAVTNLKIIDVTEPANIIDTIISNWGGTGSWLSGLGSVLNAIPGVKLVGQVASSLLTGTIDVVNRITSIPATLLTGFINSLRFNDLPSALLTGTIDVVNRITSIPSTLLNGLIDILRIPDFSAAKIISGTLDILRIPDMSANKIVSGVMNILRIPNLGRAKIIGANDFANVLQDGSFESADTVAPSNSTIATITDPAVGGTKALQLVSTGGNVDASLLPNPIEVRPDQYWYIKGKIRKLTTATTGQAGVYMTVSLDGASPSYPAFSAVPGGGHVPAFTLNELTQNVWTDFEGIYKILPSRNRMTIRPSIRSGTPTGETIQFDDLEVREVTMQRSFIDDIAAAWNQAGQSITTIFNNIPGAKLVGQVASSLLTGTIDVVNRIVSIPATLLTGFINSARFQDLPAALLTGTIDVINRIVSVPANILTGTIDTVNRIASIAADKLTGFIDTLRFNNLPANLLTGTIDVVNRIAGIPAALINSGQIDLLRIPDLTDSKVPGLAAIANAIVDGANNIGSGIQDTINKIFGLGNEANQAAADAAKQLAALQATNNGTGNNGKAYIVDFSEYPVGSLPSILTKFLDTGSGNTIQEGTTLGYPDPSGNAGGDERLRYNVGVTDSDYQEISAVMAYGIENDVFGNTGYNYVLGRLNSTGSQYVIAQFTYNSVRIGYRNGGSETYPIAAVSRSVPAGSILRLRCGTVGSVRVYQALVGSSVVASWNDSGSATAVGASNRGGGLGFGGSSRSVGGQYTPGGISLFTLTDNTPAPIVGQGLMAYRSAGATGGFNSNTDNMMPNAFYDMVEAQTSEISWNAATSTATINASGWYGVSFNARGNTAVGSTTADRRIETLLFKNGVVVDRQTPIAMGFLESSTDTLKAGYQVQYSGFLYCAAGSTLRPGIRPKDVGMDFGGGAGSDLCNLRIVKLNP